MNNQVINNENEAIDINLEKQLEDVRAQFRDAEIKYAEIIKERDGYKRACSNSAVKLNKCVRTNVELIPPQARAKLYIPPWRSTMDDPGEYGVALEDFVDEIIRLCNFLGSELAMKRSLARKYADDAELAKTKLEKYMAGTDKGLKEKIDNLENQLAAKDAELAKFKAFKDMMQSFMKEESASKPAEANTTQSEGDVPPGWVEIAPGVKCTGPF